MKKFLKAGAVVMSAILTLCIPASCTSTAEARPEEQAPPAGQTAEQVESSEPTSASSEAVELSILVDMDWFFMDNWGGRPVDDAVTEKTGVKLNVTRVADSQQLPILMASNQLPDLVYTDSRLRELSNDNQSYELGELLKQHAPNMSLPPEQIGIAMNGENKFYYLPNFWKDQTDWEDPHFLPGVGSSGVIYRSDILAETGLALPNSPDELETLLAKVKELHPDMVPLATYSEGIKYTYFINQPMLTSESYNLAEENGDWKFFAGTEAYKNGMKFLNGLAQKGLLVPEMFTLKYEQYVQETQSGNVFMWVDDSSNLDVNNQAYESLGIEGAKAEFMLGSIYPDSPYPYVDPSGGWAGTFISKNCENVEAAAKFLEWMSSDEAGKLVGWGVEGEHYDLDTDGYPVLKPEVAAMWNENYDETVRVTGVGAWFFGTKAWYESVRTYSPDANPPMTEVLLYIKDNMQMRPECATLYAEPGSDESAVLASLNNTEITYYPRVIFAKDDAEFEQMMTEFTSQLNTQGMESYNAFIKDKWGKIKQTYGLN